METEIKIIHNAYKKARKVASKINARIVKLEVAKSLCIGTPSELIIVEKIRQQNDLKVLLRKEFVAKYYSN